MQVVISSVEVRDAELGVMVHCVTFNKDFFFLIKAQTNTDILSASHLSAEHTKYLIYHSKM